MPDLKRSLIIPFVLLLSLSYAFPHAYASNLAPSAEAAILMEASQNKVIYEKNADAKLPMASTTKIMTAVTVLEFFTPETKMTVPADAVGTEGTSASLEAGEVYTLRDLLIALLLQSANDAAVAIAVNAAGSVDDFAVLMNRTANHMGLTNTNFKNPHGLPDGEHYTTARDLAMITSHALKNECIKEIVAMQKASILSEGGKVRYFRNHNKMLSLYEGANGVKTGYTKASGRCLVSSAERDGVTLIAVTLNCPNDWREHTAMLDHGFSIFPAYTIIK